VSLLNIIFLVLFVITVIYEIHEAYDFSEFIRAMWGNMFWMAVIYAICHFIGKYW
jgi:hypothetical protein